MVESKVWLGVPSLYPSSAGVRRFGAVLVLCLLTAVAGCGHSSSSNSNETASATPAISGLSPTSGVVGAAVTIAGSNFRGDAGDEYGHIQWGRSGGERMEYDEHYRCGAERRDDGQCCGDGGGNGEWWIAFHGDSGDSGADDQWAVSLFGLCRGAGDDYGNELWGDAGNEHSDVQWSCGGNGSERMECDEHYGCGAEWSDDGQCGGDGRGTGE